MRIRAHHKRRALLALTLMLTAAALSGCYLYPAEEEQLPPPLIQPAAITYSTYTVKRDNIQRELTSSGTFRAADYYKCQFTKRGGYVSVKNVKLGQMVKQGDVLVELDTAPVQSDMRRREINVERARLALKNAKSTRNKDAIQMAEWDLEMAELDYKDAKDTLESSVLRAPHDGRVSSVARVDVGEYVGAYTTLVVVDNADTLLLEVKGDKVSEFADGQIVNVNYRKNDYQGEVVMTPRSATADTPLEMRDFVRIRVDGMDQSVAKIGDDARVVVVLERRENVIVIPKNLVRNYLGRRYVQLLVDGLPTERDVEIGLETPTLYEIVKGLNEGDQIIDR